MRAWHVWALLVAAAAAVDDVAVLRLQLALEQDYTLQVDRYTEYILQFVPTAQQAEAAAAAPARVRVRSGGGTAARPLLVTARQRAGAVTWQLPQRSGDALLYELERTLCLDDFAHADDANCEDAEGGSARRGQFSLHVATSCAQPFSVRLRADLVRDWRLVKDATTLMTITQTSPRVHYYRFAAREDSVRLVLRSDDERCATVAVQGYTCPIAETEDELDGSTIRMTMLRSGGAQLSKSRYPNGFYVIGVLGESDTACTGEVEERGEDSEWLWEAAVWPGGESRPGEGGEAPQRVKRLQLRVKASLSRAQYAVGTVVLLAVFLMFYVMFGVLILAQRWDWWRQYVGPTAKLARATSLPEPSSTPTRLENGAQTAAAGRPRRDSTATFDSSDNSDTDSEVEARVPPPSAGEAPPAPPSAGDAPQPAQRPFGLPAVLHVAALARRRARVLRARSDRYLTTLCTVAVFYALPVLQFVAAFQMILNVSGSLDLCYYNFLCAHPAGALSDFNHVYSNLGYLLLGALFMLQLRRRRTRRRNRPRDEEYGIPQHYGLLSSLGAAMMVVALLSASYHVCPNRLNFQFDTAFMYVLAVLCMVKIYQSRHPDINARAHATFAVLAVFIALVVWGVLGGGPLFWGVFSVAHVFTFLLLSLRIYYVGQFRLEKESLAETARALRGGDGRPLYTARLVALVVANAVNWAFAIYGLARQSADIASHLLSVLLCNALLYMAFYLSMKLLHGERVRWYAWAFAGGATLAWAPALYLFASGSTDWSTTPARSRHRNHECRALQFYDSHDLWHALSAVALYLTFNVLLTWDDGLSAVKRTDIAVF